MVLPDLPAEARGGLFPETRWTLVLAARLDPQKRKPALEALVKPRWKALYVVARKHGLGASEAEDAVQGFVARLLEGDVLERLDPGKGRLRSYLRTAFRHYLASARQEERAQKRGSGMKPLELGDAEAWLASSEQSPDVLFDRAWALELFADALGELEREYTSGARRGPFEVVRELSFPLSKPSILREVRDLLGARVSALDVTEGDIALRDALGRTRAQPSVVVPVVIRQRVVVMIYGDRAGRDFGLADLPDLLAFLPKVSGPRDSLIPSSHTMRRASAVARSMSLAAPVVRWLNTRYSAARPPISMHSERSRSSFERE